MAAPTSDGRMLRKAISRSRAFASLSPDAQVLFCLLIPHLNAYGKSNGNTYYIKGEVVPMIDRFDLSRISVCMQEISDKTRVKWFEIGGAHYIHALDWDDHQNMRSYRRGKDSLPAYSGTSPGLVQDYSRTSPELVRDLTCHDVDNEQCDRVDTAILPVKSCTSPAKEEVKDKEKHIVGNGSFSPGLKHDPTPLVAPKVPRLTANKFEITFQWFWKLYATQEGRGRSGDKKKTRDRMQKSIRSDRECLYFVFAVQEYLRQVDDENYGKPLDRQRALKLPEVFVNSWQGYVPDDAESRAIAKEQEVATNGKA